MNHPATNIKKPASFMAGTPLEKPAVVADHRNTKSTSPSTRLKLIEFRKKFTLHVAERVTILIDNEELIISMTKLEAIVQPNKFEAVKEALSELGAAGMTISEVRGHGRQKGHTEHYRGREYSIDLIPKIKVEVVLADNLVEAAIDAIIKAAATGKIGDGKIFLYKVEEAIRIRNQERGAAAI
jgi:nitrogen regulatory protein P-II 1